MSPDLLRPNEREALYAPDRRMNASYYGVDPSGQPAIDAFLSAGAHAGKGYHHTESWSDDGEWSRWGEGRSAVDVIQAAANEAALALLDAAEERDAALRAERDALASKVERVRALHYRRPHGVFDFVAHGQTEFPDLCDYDRTAWPCPTIRALDGEADHER